MFERTFKSFSIGVAIIVIAVCLSSVNFAQAGDIVSRGDDNFGQVSDSLFYAYNAPDEQYTRDYLYAYALGTGNKTTIDSQYNLRGNYGAFAVSGGNLFYAYNAPDEQNTRDYLYAYDPGTGNKTTVARRPSITNTTCAATMGPLR
jgi:hypothetical protein